jgi:hypothetical protein
MSGMSNCQKNAGKSLIKTIKTLQDWRLFHFSLVGYCLVIHGGHVFDKAV